MDEDPLKFDILKQIGTAYLVIKPDEDQYKVVFQSPEIANMACEVEVKISAGGDSAAAANEDAEDKGKEASASAKDAKDYLEGHQLPQFLQAALQTVIKEKPADPYNYMARHFMSGYNAADTRAAPRSKAEETAVKEEVKVEEKPEEAHDSELDAWGKFIFEVAGKNRATQLEHAAVATCSVQLANLERQMRALMDGATELQESLRALSLDQSIVQTAIPAALMVTAGKSHQWPKTVAGLCNYEAEVKSTMEAYERRVANGDMVSGALIPELKAAVVQVECDAVDVKVKLARMFSESLKATTVEPIGGM